MALSTENRLALHAAFVTQIRHFIAGTILFNQSVADRVGLSLTDMQCINLLELLGPSTPGKLAASTGLTTGGVTVMLDRLEKAGLVKRQPNPKDRRSILVKVNAKKLQKVNSFYSGINQRLETFLSGRSEAEIQSVITFLSSMNAIRAERSSELK
jgi:MarR family transcriptional regulator, organic hydroperoxide resistance regulator